MENKAEMKMTYDVLEGLCELTVAEDNMEARLTLKKPEEGLQYTEEAIVQYLQEKEVFEGISRWNIQKAISEESYDEPFLVAEGMAATNGEDGYYEFFFEVDLQSRPLEREDGSVDYLNMKLFEEAEAGQLLAVYHPATRGMYGYTIKKQILKAMDGKNLPPLKGSGFFHDKEKQEYRAKIDGRIVFQDNLLKIDPLLVVDEVSYSTGNIKFRGDVLVKDCVRSGVRIEATGDVMVNGNVECATIICGGNVLIKRGATADYKGLIQAGGNVSGKFFETITIEAGDSAYSDYFLNCDIQAGKNVIATGRKGSLAGGTARCREQVKVAHLGNKAGVETRVEILYENETARKQAECLKELETLQKERGRLLKEILKYRNNNQDEELEKSLPYMKLEYQVGLREEGIKKAEKLLEELQEEEQKSSQYIIVEGVAYDGCCIAFGEVEEAVTGDVKELRFGRVGAQIVKESLKEIPKEKVKQE